MTEPKLTAEDGKALTDALLVWREAGVKNPLIPLGYDVNGDGVADSWGLDSFGKLTLVPGVAIEDTVYVSTGEGFEANA